MTQQAASRLSLPDLLCPRAIGEKRLQHLERICRLVVGYIMPRIVHDNPVKNETCILFDGDSGAGERNGTLVCCHC
jgi:hypothetical protein